MKKHCAILCLISTYTCADPVIIADNTEDDLSNYSEEELLQHVFGNNRKQKDVMMEFNITLDGEKIGAALVILGKEQKIFAQSLKELLYGYLLESEIKLIDRLIDQNGFISFENLKQINLDTKVNTSNLNIEIVVPLSKKKTRTLYNRRIEKGLMPNVQPANFSSMLNIRVSHGYDQKLGNRREQNSHLSLSPAINIMGLVLEGEGTFEKSGTDDRMKFHRDYSSLVYDFPHDDIKITMGDVFAMSPSYQSVPRLWGICFRKEAPSTSVENFQSNLQITVLRPSRMEIYANGSLIRTKDHIAPGTYIIDDIPYNYGSNKIEIKLIDDTGRAKIIDASAFFDSNIVAPGEFDFEFDIGQPEINDPQEGRYSKHNRVISSFVRVGLPSASDILFGISKNKVGDNKTIEFRNSNMLGFFEIRYGISNYQDNGKKTCGHAKYFSYSTPSINFDNGMSLSFGGSIEKTDDFFVPYLEQQKNDIAPLDLLEKIENRNGQATIRKLHAYVSNIFGINSSISYTTRKYRHDKSDKSWDISLSKGFRIDNKMFSYANTYFSYSRTKLDNRKTDHTFSLSFSLSMKDGGTISAGYAKRQNTSSQNVSYSGNALNNDLSYFISGYKSEDKKYMSGNVNYYHSRFKADLNCTHGDNSSHSIKGGLETNLYFADGSFGISKDRSYNGGFVIVKPINALENTSIKVGSSAESGILGGAVISTSRHHVTSTGIDTKSLPDGVDIKNSSIVAYGEYKRGALVEISANGTYMAKGYLVDRNDQPFMLATGYVVLENDKTFAPVQFFTNSEGRFLLAGLKPGHYRMVINVEGCNDENFDIKNVQNKTIDLGRIVCSGDYEELE